jgi:hypothetical protein
MRDLAGVEMNFADPSPQPSPRYRGAREPDGSALLPSPPSGGACRPAERPPDARLEHAGGMFDRRQGVRGPKKNPRALARTELL